MTKKEEHNTKKLIQSIELDKPSVNFTENVMSKLDVIVENEILKDEALIVMLKKNSHESPDKNFSANVMAILNSETVNEYKPIISKKVWNILFLLFGSFVVYILITGPKMSNDNNLYISKLSTFFERITTSFGNFISESIQISSILMLSVLSLSVLLLLDYLLRLKKIM